MIDVPALVEKVKSGDVRAVSRAISLVEDHESFRMAILDRVGRPARRAIVIGITGYPGAGKSTLIERLITLYRQRSKTVAVLALDVSSPRTGGAILGDRIRMQDHAGDSGVYIRSMATRGARGGLAPAVREAAAVLEAAGYDVILIETVGVGQADVEILGVAQTVVAVVAPGLGDEVQAMKAGLLEVAHIVVVNKADRADAAATISALKDWLPVVLATVAVKGEGITELVDAIEKRA
jgi:LAO/AO transport system kinase